MDTTTRRKAILLARLSDNREDLDLTEEGIPASLDDQIQRMGERADQLGWDVFKVIKNPRLSAYKKRKIRLPNGETAYRVFRPDLREALDHLSAGRANAMIALDLDRAFRDPRDLQDLIDVVEHSAHSIVVESVTGSLHMEKGRDNFDAEVRVLVANKSSRDTARRVSAARERQAKSGHYGGGGRRPFGFLADRVTVDPAEASILADCAHRLLQGVSLRSLASELRTGNVPTVTGASWSPETLRDILMRPRNAGQMVHKGEIVGKAPWSPIVAPDVHTAVVAVLTDPDRRTGPAGQVKYLGSGLFLCGVCGDGTYCNVRLGGRTPAYRCADKAHLVRSVRHVDELVTGLIIARLSRADAADLVTRPSSDVDVAGLRVRRAAVREALDEMARDRADGLIDRAQLIAGTTRGKAQLREIDEALHVATVDSPLSPLIGAPDVAKVWAALPLADQRLVLAELLEVTIQPCGQRGSGFDPSTVTWKWR